MRRIDLLTKEAKEVYDWCVRNVSEEIDRNDKGDFTAFDGSTALAVCFDCPKEDTIADLLEYRRKNK